MSASNSFTKLCLLVVVHILSVHSVLEAQHKPLSRVFVAASEERYDVSITLKAQTQSVSIQTVASKTYVMPEAHAAEVRLKWRARRRILLVQPDGHAELEEDLTETQPCEDIQRPRESSDAKLRASLESLCASLRAPVTMRYAEDSKGSLHEAAAPTLAPDLGEEAPPLLALWLRRAVRPNVVFPSLAIETGARAKQELRPPGDLLKNAQGSESAEWLDAQSNTPAASLHVVQQLGWDAQARATTAADVATHPGGLPRRENFFADSITTLSLLDGSVLRADRSASRTTSHRMEPVAGLPEPPEFSSKLTISVTIERLP
jgi:hypothetical protein